ncbi:hypothetical protein HB803_13860 [Listeria welshimeri]|nr:hypothetical protein [Listeria welshimeri]
MKTFELPIIKKMIINNFDLYECPFEINFSQTLNLIYGTNGTGKSTLLHIILYSIIGPYTRGIKFKNYEGKKRALRSTLKESFFRDRMSEMSEEANVVVEFEIKGKKIITEHSLYNNKLLAFSIEGERFDEREYSCVTYKSYEKKYVESSEDVPKEITEYLIGKYHIALENILDIPGGTNTFIEMLVDTMFFSEDRKYTFWQENLHEIIIGKYLVNPNFYEGYLKIRSETQYLGSKYKQRSEAINYAKKFLKSEKEYKKQLDNEIDDTNIENIDELINNLDSLNSNRISLKKDFQIIQDKLIREKKQYEFLGDESNRINTEWYSYLYPDNYQKYYTKFINTITKGVCPFCGENHTFEIETEKCIFCHESISVKKTIDLVELDIQRKDIQVKIEASEKNIKLLNIEKNKFNELLREKDSKILRLENQIEKLTNEENSSGSDDKKRLEVLQKAKDEALKDLNAAKENENRMKSEIDKNLEGNFKLFANNFEKFGRSFFGEGRKIKVELPNKEKVIQSTEQMVNLVLDNRLRDSEYSLSESQRIFSDLAFRFTILDTFHSHSFFLCETPDSSLDKYHEKNAFKTFKSFMDAGNVLILTANMRDSILIEDLGDKYKESINIIDLTEKSSLRLRK